MVWVIGCNGMLGTELCRQFKEKNIEFVGTDRNVDITDPQILAEFVKGKDISFIVNCSAYTAVDKAESEPELAAKINVEGVRNIAVLANQIHAKLIHISTDYVFDGTGIVEKEPAVVEKKTTVVEALETTIRPYDEDDSIAPIGIYGKTKAEGEKAVVQNLKEYYILRTAWLYGWAGKNFVYTMIRAMNIRDAVKVVNDQKGTPTFAGDLAEVIIRIVVSKDNSVPYGIYHVTDLGEITWWEFTNEIKKQVIELQSAGKFQIPNSSFLIPNCTVNPCSTSEYPTPAKRPAYSVLSKEKIQKVLGIKLPDWKESLSVFLKSELFDKSRIE
ncbi:MAG: dTDP-4-dehydrorhamnose reductase [Treponema sp.]|nr:dTDP-4-dehydrorhamnose reductase [Candidatus Treponema equifaecale]